MDHIGNNSSTPDRLSLPSLEDESRSRRTYGEVCGRSTISYNPIMLIGVGQWMHSTVDIEAAFKASIVRDKLLDCGPVLLYLYF